FVSTNSGAAWSPASAPSNNWSAVAGSADGSRLIAAVNGGLLYISTNAGDSWTSVTTNVLLGTNQTSASQSWSSVASSADGAKLTAAVNNGPLFISTNGGAGWLATTTAGSAPALSWSALAASPDGQAMVALARFGGSYKSSDGGLTWSKLA